MSFYLRHIPQQSLYFSTCKRFTFLRVIPRYFFFFNVLFATYNMVIFLAYKEAIVFYIFLLYSTIFFGIGSKSFSFDPLGSTRVMMISSANNLFFFLIVYLLFLFCNVEYVRISICVKYIKYI